MKSYNYIELNTGITGEVRQL